MSMKDVTHDCSSMERKKRMALSRTSPTQEVKRREGSVLRT